MASLRLIESIGQVFGLLSCYSSNQCMQSGILTCQNIKSALSFFLLIKLKINAMKAGLNSVIKPDNCPLSSRDRQVFEDLFLPIGLSWLHYYTLKYNGAFEWIILNSDEKITLLSFNQDIIRCWMPKTWQKEH